VLISTIIARMSRSQSQKPTTGNIPTYIRVVHGRKMMPRIGQIMVLNVRFHFIGQKSHQTIAARRGPKRNRVVMKQHIANLLTDYFIPWDETSMVD
jgi:hypothetical protein